MEGKRILLSLAYMGDEEQKYIKEAFDTNWVIPLGPNVDAFEEDISTYLGHPTKYVAALCSGTSAIHLGLVLLGVKPGDEVVCQSLTFAASSNPIIYQGAKPVFVDSEDETWNMDPNCLRIAIEDRLHKTGRLPKVIIPVHVFGMPAQMNEITSIANEQ